MNEFGLSKFWLKNQEKYIEGKICRAKVASNSSTINKLDLQDKLSAYLRSIKIARRKIEVLEEKYEHFSDIPTDKLQETESYIKEVEKKQSKEILSLLDKYKF